MVVTQTDSSSHLAPHAPGPRATGEDEVTIQVLTGTAAAGNPNVSVLHTGENAVEVQEGKQKEEMVIDKEEDKDTGAVVLATHHENGLEDQTNYLPPRQIITVFCALTLCIALSFLDQTIISSALPNISAAFNAGRSSSWVASMYLLTSTAVQPLWGRLSDIFGRKYCMIACVIIFMIGSLACALAKSMTELIVFRGLQGAGGGGLITLGLIIISDIVTLKERGKYQGINEITITISNGIGPVIGGLLSEKVSWQWCFWINLPLSALAIVVVVFFLPLKRVKGSYRRKLAQVDYPGSIMSCFAAAMIMFPLLWGGISFPWVSPQVLGTLFGGVGLWVVFLLWEWKGAKIPIIPVSIFKTTTVNAVFVCTLFSGATILTQVYYIPQFLQIAMGVSAIRSGVLILPLLLMVTTLVFISGQIVARTGEYKPSICVGYALWTIGLGLTSTLNEKTSVARLCGYLIVTAAGQGQTLQTTMVAAQAAVSRSEMSIVTSVRNFLRSLGGSLALAVAATVINNTLTSQLTREGLDSSLISAFIDDSTGIWRPSKIAGSTLFDLPQAQKQQMIDAYVKGFQTVWRILIAIIAFDFVISSLLLKRLSLNKDDEEALKERARQWVEQRGTKGKTVDLEKGQGGHLASQHTTVVGDDEPSEDHVEKSPEVGSNIDK